MKKSFIILLSVLAVVGFIGFTLAKNKKKIEANKVVVDRSIIPVAVSTVKAEYQLFDGKVSLPANLELNNEATIAIGIQGKIEKLGIEVGSRVAKGQVIGHLDSRLKLINLKANELTLSKLEKDLQRNTELFKGNAGTELSVTNSKYDVENTRIQIEQVKQQITDGNIISPISGIVTSRKLMAGEFASPGTVIATVVDDVHLKAVVFVNEKNVYQLKLGQMATIFSDVFPSKNFVGHVKFISPKGDENHNYRVELQLNTNQLRAGTYVMVGFDLGKKTSVLQIPKLALVEGTKNPYVYVVQDNVATIQKLTIGREIGENIEVISGLQAGQEVVTSGQINLTNGSKISKTK
ncbi:efflux RND transporter periplasmic adaptor subunit [Arcicella sp. LKC2W]|uniref:efflux RND transporter periplasmic adaptor subunit n=1 Tax=Arcicella sp. LKC2W TaxID=2984198 RepID=UPI002B206F5D|nr:efflux RND transporter periplasmic adaptor subunit [Arcicella sp. LKC2W]MEA5460468.1 efflux RND transporter periplasmic adaptor subunit [Arcicella sp. LKC2W]